MGRPEKSEIRDLTITLDQHLVDAQQRDACILRRRALQRRLPRRNVLGDGVAEFDQVRGHYGGAEFDAADLELRRLELSEQGTAGSHESFVDFRLGGHRTLDIVRIDGESIPTERVGVLDRPSFEPG